MVHSKENQAIAFESYCKSLIALEIEGLDGVPFKPCEMVDDILADISYNGTIEVSENTRHFVIEWFSVCGDYINAEGKQWTVNPFEEYDLFLAGMVSCAVRDLLEQSSTYNNMQADESYTYNFELNQAIGNDIQDKHVSWIMR